MKHYYIYYREKCPNYKPKNVIYPRPFSHLTPDGMKWCTRCGQYKPKNSDFTHSTQSKDGLLSVCKKCHKERKKENPLHKVWEHATRIKKTYGITLIQFDELLKKQNGNCALCKKPLDIIMGSNKRKARKPAIDHNHKTGKIRGLLHGKCNSGLGLFDEDIEKLQHAVEYLKKDQEVSI